MSAESVGAREVSGGRADLAVCCSGVGGRSATYCLGGLQALEEGGLLGKAGWILGVSGGSYIAASRALVAQDLEDPIQSVPVLEPRESAGRTSQADHAGAYARGTPEEQRLRENIPPDVPTGLASIILIPFGGAVTIFLVITPLYVFSYALGWLLRWQNVLTLRPNGVSASFGTWTWWLTPAFAAAVTIMLFLWWRATIDPGSAADRARWTGRAAAITVGLALAMLVVPRLISFWYNWTGAPAIILRFPVAEIRRWPELLAGLVVVVTAVAWFSARQLGRATRQPVAAGKAPGLFKLVTQWAQGPLQAWVGMLPPWLATATTVVVGGVVLLITFAAQVGVLLVIVIGTYAVLVSSTTASRTGYTGAQFLPFIGGLGILLLTRIAIDVNRVPLRDYYKSQLARAYAATRSAAVTTDPVLKRRLLASASRTKLTDLRCGSRSQELVISATVFVNANREVPPVGRPFCLAFDSDKVTLRSRLGWEEKDISALTADYEHLIGHTRFTLFDVAAIAGGFSPLMGASARGVSRMLFTVTNLRFGVWLPHPQVVRSARAHLQRTGGRRGGERWWTRRTSLLLLWYMAQHPFWHRNAEKQENREARLWAHVLELRERSTETKGLAQALTRLRAAVCWRAMQPTLGILWAEAVGKASYRGTWIHVTDGGHYDELGLVEALRRGAKNIVAFDANDDHPDTWFTLGDAVALARADAGVEIALDPTVMTRTTGDGHPLRLLDGEVICPWARGTFLQLDHRPGQARSQCGEIWVCKLGWWSSAPWDIRAYAAGHPGYPYEIRRHHLYSGREFEAYRELGARAIADMASNWRFPPHG